MSQPPETVYLFRGTTDGWPGSSNAVHDSLTYTSIDPLVATLFAVECRNHGKAVVLALERGRFPEVEPGELDQVFQVMECSVTLSVAPLDFAKNAVWTFDVDRCLEVLSQLGISDLPPRIKGKSHLHDTLAESHRLGQRLTREQIRRFTALITGGPQ
jgi:hypothetical protein